ncbi:large ribosomal RNA subunit accumulation protein YCED homolog 1, chloroplastic-like [Argentina anserina]|uniref:large ribosomal RNA subunit accumulation protein YCED homolog 1, chloroplastic-like n=1 Tax=Argentina anserina TaxID=57926 RepID=UPI0021763D28|nr:large ribosomal RNA subunit accumulation protein YCED homolog 1, chloroplastic-like [Potentilla anserina]
MSFVVTSPSIVSSSYITRRGGSRLKCCEGTSKVSHFPCIHCKFQSCITKNIHTPLRRKPDAMSTSTVMNCAKPNFQSFTDESTVFLDLGDHGDEDGEDIDSPWEGAVVYKRNASITHVEYCTTLERLGLGNLSTEVSKSRASVMGLRVTKAVKDYPNGTPVQISIDITRRKQKLRLDGIIKTVITLTCNRCGDPAAESIFSNFSLLLTDEPVEEPDILNMGVIYGDNVKTSTGFGGEENDDDSIDFEDQLYFRPEDKEIDISKHIRDSVHLEITISATCNPNCKGLCLSCGKNLNTGNCICGKQEVKKTTFGPLGNLKKQMQQR